MCCMLFAWCLAFPVVFHLEALFSLSPSLSPPRFSRYLDGLFHLEIRVLHSLQFSLPICVRTCSSLDSYQDGDFASSAASPNEFGAFCYIAHTFIKAGSIEEVNIR